MKDVRKRLNAEVDVIRVENGAYRPFKKTLSAFLTHIVSKFACDKLLPVSSCSLILRNHQVMRHVLKLVVMVHAFLALRVSSFSPSRFLVHRRMFCQAQVRACIDR